MMKKIKLPDFKIKWMLWGLVSGGIVVIWLISVTSLKWTLPDLIESQSRLTDIVMPIDAANQKIRMAVANFSLHNHLISSSRSLKELEQLEEGNHVQIFKEGIQQLKELSQKANIPDALQKIQRLENLYTDTLTRDADIFKTVQRFLRLENEIKDQINVLESTSAALHENAEALSVKFGLFKQDELQGDSNRIQKDSNALRLRFALLTNYCRQILMETDSQKIGVIKTSIVQTANLVGMALKNLADMMPQNIKDSSEISQLLQKIETDYNLLKSMLLEGDNSIIILRTQWLTEQKRLTDSDTALKAVTEPLTANLNELQLLSDRIRNQAEQESGRVIRNAQFYIGLGVIIATAIMIVTGFWLTRRITSPINKLIDFADIISQGDLTAEIEKSYDDEVGELVFKLSNMAHNLNALIGQVQRSGIQVTSSATELSATSKQQEAVMKTQLDSTNYVVQSIGQISSVSEELVETMQRVAAMSDQTAEFASSGQADLSQMEEAMRHMENASKSISGKLEAINEKAANITSVVTTITKVADQTNLLSLNAAIEAEKAGEYGRGFTVVAREIRRLADQTAVATLDIEQMVQEMQSAVSAGVMEMDAFITEVQRSADNVGKISTQLTRIIEQVQALSPSFEGVNESMQLQAGNAQQINTSMVNLSEEMQQTVDSLRESFMAIEQLNDAARGLQDEVSRFRVM